MAKALTPIDEQLKTSIEQAPILHADETPWKLLEGDKKKRWYLWGFFDEKNVYYEAHHTRVHEVAKDFLQECKANYLMSDAYSGYARCTDNTSIKNAYCMAHARRKWVEAEPHYPEVTQMMDWFSDLYEIERDTCGHPREQRHHARQERSKLILDEMKAYALNLDVLPKSSIGKTRNYLLKHWREFTAFLDDERLPIDNNLAERGLRGPVVGRKNYYGNHSKQGAKTMAILYSIIESCKLNKVDPFAYLRETLKAILYQQPLFTPERFAK